jgi:RNA-directed DNA polymerase
MSLVLTPTPEQLREQFVTLRTRADVARLLDVEENRLIYHLYISPPTERYAVFQVRKRSGDFREIAAPVTALKIIQRKLNQVLQVVYQVKPAVHGFVQGKSIVTNAAVHSGKRFVLNIDLMDFFPTIHFGRIRGMFMALPYNLNEEVAQVLAQICCFNSRLPQGAPTSPIISNMICAKMDSQLLRLAQRHRCIYTRYADDISFSTSMPQFPSAIARILGRTGQVEIGDELQQIVEGNGFALNSRKTRLQTRYGRQEVTGLTTNRRPNVQRKYVRQIRAMLHAWDHFGLDDAQDHFVTRYDAKHRNPERDEPPLFGRVVKGKIEFLGMVRGKNDPLYLRFHEQLRRLDPDLAGGPADPRMILLAMFEELEQSEDAQRRGYLLQDLIRRIFESDGIPIRRSFTRNEGAEQIDGAFAFEGWYYIVECRWRERLANIRELDGLKGQVDRSGRQTMGVFLSINGWSENVPGLLMQNPDKSIVLMNGEDLRSVLDGSVNLAGLIRGKLARLNLRGESFYSAAQFLQERAAEV